MNDCLALMQKCVDAMNRGELARAVAYCERLLTNWPNQPEVLQLAATVRLAEGSPESAIDMAGESLRRRPDHLPTLMLAARACGQIGQSSDAERFLFRATEIAPEHPEPAFLLCAVRLTQKGAPSSAEIEALIARFPDHASGCFSLAAALEKAGRFREAIACCKQAARAAPSWKVFQRLGELLYRDNRLAEAEAALRDSIAYGADQPLTWFRLGLVLQDGGNHVAAASAYERALALAPDLVEAQVNLGVSLQETGDLDAAKRAYGRAIALRGDSFGRIAQALCMAPSGELWLDLASLKAHLLEAGRSRPERSR